MHADVVVIGAGFGGLGAALALAEQGARVVLCEALAYPGGCASTFARDGARYETGATLFAGLGPGQFLRRLRDEYAPDLRLDFPDPAVEIRAPGLNLPVAVGRERLLQTLSALPDAPVAGLRSFFAEQGRVATALWELFDQPELLPPWDPRGLLGLAVRAPRLAELLRLIGRPLASVVHRHGLTGWEPLRIYLDAACQITVQTSSDRAEAPFAMAALDYTNQGAGHVHGGIGELAWALVRAIEARGGTTKMACRVRGLRRVDGVWEVDARGETLRTPCVISNQLPQAVAELVGPSARLERLAAQVRSGWGAAMVYLRVGPLPRAEAHHLQLIADPTQPFSEGNHIFCSISAADEHRVPGEPEQRTATVSTHVPLPRTIELSPEQRGLWLKQIQDRMGDTLQLLAPELTVHHRMTASPRTWARFTRREHGAVGGVPRLAGLHHYRNFWPEPVAPGVYLVGDSVFPGQSALAAALGGYKLGGKLAGSRELVRRGASGSAE